MRRLSNIIRNFTLLTSFLAVACSDDGGNSNLDIGPAETGIPLADQGQLWPCDTPGKSCNPHNPCAIDPICGPDFLCRAAKIQSCDDGLECTTDVCKGMGLCDHQPKKDTCVLSTSLSSPGADGGQDGGSSDAGAGQTALTCHKNGDRNPSDPCELCDSATSQTKWTGANGGACDDGKGCTKDDYCQNGLCKGVDYTSQCADIYSCTDDVCDGKGGCVGNQLRSDQCLINGVCVKDQASDTNGCQICDVKTSQSSWTALVDKCTIGGICYKKGDKSTNGCSECKPSVSATSWTPVANVCLISSTCYKNGDKSTNGCSECKPSVSATSWTPIANNCLIAGTCYKDGAAHTQGCAKCDTATSGTSWTVTNTSYCIASQKCVDKSSSVLACGACGAACGAGETCTQGKCACGTTVGTVGSGGVCLKTQSCDKGSCVNVPSGTLIAPISLDFDTTNGGLTGTKDWEWGKIGTWTPTTSCDSSANPPKAGHSGMGVWATKLNDCYTGFGNASSACSNASLTDDSILTLKVKIPSGWTSATLIFWQWYDLFLDFDWSEIRIDGKVAVQTCTGSTPSPPGWTKRTIDLKAYAGKIIKIDFHMMATTVVNYSGWYIDDLAISGS